MAEKKKTLSVLSVLFYPSWSCRSSPGYSRTICGCRMPL